jgi:hypothetical protein
MEIKFGGVFDIAMFRRAIELAQRPSRTTRATRWLFAGLLLLVLGIQALDLIQGRGVDSTSILRSAVLVVVIAYFLARPLINLWLVSRRIAADPQPKNLSGKITEEGFTYRFMETEAEVPWNLITRKRWTENMVVLLIPRGGMFFFPRALFHSQQDWQQFLEAVDSRIVETRK